MATNSGSVYAEAELNIDKFLSAVDGLESASQRIADSMEAPGMAVAALGEAIAEAFEAAGLEATAAGGRLSAAYAEGIMSGAGASASSATGMTSAALAAASIGASGASRIGSMISAGVAAGIRSGQGSVVAAAVAMVNAAISAANAAAKIHSPSKVTAEMGEFWDEGWAVGIEKYAGVATKAASGMVGQLVKTTDKFGAVMAPDIEDAIRAAVYVEPPAGVAYGAARDVAPTVRVAGQAIDYDALADAMNQRQVALYMNNRRMAQVMASDTARAQNARSRSIALGYGK